MDSKYSPYASKETTSYQFTIHTRFFFSLLNTPSNTLARYIYMYPHVAERMPRCIRVHPYNIQIDIYIYIYISVLNRDILISTILYGQTHKQTIEIIIARYENKKTKYVNIIDWNLDPKKNKNHTHVCFYHRDE